jgi:IclR family acetate operon transcriptional repressor
MERLREITDESVRLWGHDGDRIVLLENMESRQAVRSVLQPGGTTIPLHASAAGKAMLARLPDDEVDHFLDQPLVALTPQTITDPEILRGQLRAIRRKGYAETHREAWKDVGAVAAAIHDPSGRPLAAIALALPMHRLTEAITKRYGKAVAEATRALSQQLGSECQPRVAS